MYVIINGVSSDTIQGLQVLSLPSITKPKMRRQVDTIDGRAGDIITELGYEAYDRTITVLLHHNYDLDAITAFFNTSGEIIFSNEPDKKYYFRLLEKIDYERAVQFKTANITFHVQPYKYPVNETPLTVSSTAWEGTDYDQTPYIFRAVSDSSVDVGNREVIEQITGGTVAFNQSLEEGLRSSGNTTKVAYNRCNATFDSTTHEYTLTSLQNQGTSGFYYGANQGAVINPNHVHIISFEAKAPKTFNVKIGSNPGYATKTGFSQNVYHSIGVVVKIDSSTKEFLFNFNADNAWDGSETVYARNLMVIDLTQMFGSTIADYIYSLEQSTAGAGVSLFKSLFPKDYYPYNAGELMSVKTSARETAGFNQWDEEWELGGMSITGQPNLSTIEIRCKNYIPAFPNTQYCFTTPLWGVIYQYDSDKNFLLRTPLIGGDKSQLFTTLANTAFLRFYLQAAYGTTYQNDVCINLSKTTGSPKNGDYVPYEHHTYPLSNIELRGIPKLVSNKLTYDGDIYKADGSVERRYGIRAYQSGDATGETMITDGTNTVYKLSSSTTETTTPYTDTQICSPYGTEEFIDSRDVQIPVGHKTKYKQINDPAEITVPNAGNVPSAPTIQLTGSGTVGVYLGNAQALQVNIPEDGITIDTEAQDATSNGQLANRSVTGDYDSVRLQPGDNDVSFSGDFSAVITKYTRWV